MKSIIGVIFLVAVIVFAGYILRPSEQCTRIEHASFPVEIAAKSVAYLAEPWVERETHLTIVKWGLKARLWSVEFLQKQFWSKEDLTCPWNGSHITVDVTIPDMPSNQPDLTPVDLPTPQKH